MTNKLALKCVDLNSPYCPCLLADTNHCLFCSHLMGQEVCGCDWSGVCALYEKKWQTKVKDSYRADLDIAAPVRIETETRFEIVAQICANTYEIKFGVSTELARSLERVGAFVFLRRPEDQQFYLFPVGVSSIEENNVKVVIEAIGAKSVRLFSEENRALFVRGPYYNGVFGQPWIEKLENGRVLLLAGGMGQPPALPIARRLVKGGNRVSAIVAPGRMGKVFIAGRLKDLGVQVREIGSMRSWGLELMREIIKEQDTCPELIVSAGPDEQHYAVIRAMNHSGVNIPMAATNKATLKLYCSPRPKDAGWVGVRLKIKSHGLTPSKGGLNFALFGVYLAQQSILYNSDLFYYDIEDWQFHAGHFCYTAHRICEGFNALRQQKDQKDGGLFGLFAG